jgi:hypothetical protein
VAALRPSAGGRVAGGAGVRGRLAPDRPGPDAGRGPSRPWASQAVPRPALHVAEILGRADACRRRHRRWPNRDDGEVPGRPGLTWSAVGQALHEGHRGLRPGSSLAKLLLEHRGKRYAGLLPDFTAAQVLGWADVHHARTGGWPTCHSGPIPEAPGETWLAFDKACARRPAASRRPPAWPSSWPSTAGCATPGACARWRWERCWPGRTPTRLRRGPAAACGQGRADRLRPDQRRHPLRRPGRPPGAG